MSLTRQIALITFTWATVISSSYATGNAVQISSFGGHMVDCSNDPIDDLAGIKGALIDKANIFLVPLSLQREALDFMKGNKVLALDVEQSEHFAGSRERNGYSPYLVRACFYSVKSNSRGDPELFQRAFAAAAFDPRYFEEKKTLIAHSFGLASPKAKPGPVVFVIWHDKPINDVRIRASVAS